MMRLLRNIKLKKSETIGLSIAAGIILLSVFLLRSSDIFYFIVGLSFLIGGFPFFISLMVESRVSKEKEEMFLEFARNLVESVKAGTPVSKSIINIKTKNYGSLNPYINKLANQISLGIPIKTAFETFARDIGSPTITRAVTIISESENAGGEIEDVLESVVKSVAQVEKLRKERRNSAYNLVVQGYIIFFIFLIIMLVMQYKILPIAAGLGNSIGGSDVSGLSGNFGGLVGTGGEKANAEQLARPFFWLLIVQGFFTGLVVGKLSEGKIKAGLKHSFILVVIALLVNTGAKLFIK